MTSAFIGMTASLANTLPLLVVTMAVPCSGSDTGVHVTSGGEKVTTGRVNYLTLTRRLYSRPSPIAETRPPRATY